MPLEFTSLRSGSNGNCLMLKSRRTTILLDCGINAQCTCREILERVMVNKKAPDGVLVSHAHGDHICYSSLRVLCEQDIPIYCHHKIAKQILDKHATKMDFPPRLRKFRGTPFIIGDLKIHPISLPHATDYPNFGFVIYHKRTKIVIATDFHVQDAIANHLVNADFIFIEANHDPELLKKYWNPSSLFHLNNPKAARLLLDARKASRKPPHTVMLGHLSGDRNSKKLVLKAIRDEFRKKGVEMDFNLEVAPPLKFSRSVSL